MASKFETWRQRIRQHPIGTMVIFVLLIALIVLIVAVVLSVLSNGIGFNEYIIKSTATETTLSPQAKVTTTIQSQPGKTLWDWLQLLIVPLVLAVGGLWFSQMQKTLEQRSTTDNQHEAALQAYIDKISELLLKEHLGERTADGKLKPEYEQVRKVAQVRTITVLTQLDARRIGYVFAFLREAKLMSATSNDNVVSLGGADFHAVNWSQADLFRADLSSANLSSANLREATLYKADLSVADLRGATLIEANLSEANLSGAVLYKADLRGAILRANLSSADLREADLKDAMYITNEELEKQAKSLKGATMPDGSKHP